MENKDRITPIDIEHVQFDTAFRGYNEKQVDEFLDKLTSDYEDVIQENGKLKKEIEKLMAEVEKSHEVEQAMQKTIVAAQKTAENLVQTIKGEMLEVKRKKDAFIMEFRNALKTALEYIDKVELKLDRHFEDDYNDNGKEKQI